MPTSKKALATKDAGQLPTIATERNIDKATWLTLKNSLYPGAKDESVAMVMDYCKARQLDPMMKPVHIVPMSVKVGNNYEMRDVVMPGVNTYRIQASRSGDLAGMLPPVYGPAITEKVGTKEITYPEWAEVTVQKMINGMVVNFTAREYWLENYATKSRNDASPNAMWSKRIYGQIRKCAEAQALRQGWPEIGQQPTYEEMAGKVERDITPPKKKHTLVADKSEPKTPKPKPETKPEPAKEKAVEPEVVDGELVEDEEWFDEMLAKVAFAKNAEEVGDLYVEAKEICANKGAEEELAHLQLACKSKIDGFKSED